MIDQPSVRRSLIAGVDKGLNVLTIVAGIVFVAVVVNYIVGRRDAPELPIVGSQVILPGVNWSQHPQTLIIALRKDCPFCEASMPFYRDLIASNLKDSFHIIALFPHAVAIGSEMLKAFDVNIGDMVRADFPHLKIPGTPALMLVDAKGILKNAWIGRLSEQREEEVFAKLHVARVSRSGMSSDTSVDDHDHITAVSFANRAAGLPVIDTRPRAAFRKAHVAASLNIPFDELESRVLHEVPKDSPAAVFCDYCRECAVVVESRDAPTLCDLSLDFLRELGLSRIRVVAANLNSLETAGAQITREEK